MTWVRTNRHSSDHLEWSDLADSYLFKRVPGPWHEIADQSGQTWCGKRPGKILSSQRRTDPPPEDERRCPACVRARKQGRPLPYRRS